MRSTLQGVDYLRNRDRSRGHYTLIMPAESIKPEIMPEPQARALSRVYTFKGHYFSIMTKAEVSITFIPPPNWKIRKFVCLISTQIRHFAK